MLKLNMYLKEFISLIIIKVNSAPYKGLHIDIFSSVKGVLMF